MSESDAEQTCTKLKIDCPDCGRQLEVGLRVNLNTPVSPALVAFILTIHREMQCQARNGSRLRNKSS